MEEQMEEEAVEETEAAQMVKAEMEVVVTAATA